MEIMKQIALFLAIIFVLFLALNSFATEPICPGGSNPRSDIIWCAEFENYADTACINNYFTCWQTNGYDHTILPSGNYEFKVVQGTAQSPAAVGNGFAKMWLKISTVVMATAFNVFNRALNLRGKILKPNDKGRNYETLKLSGYIAIFDIEKDVKVVLYGNGVISNDKVKIDTFSIIKNDILNAMNSCEIIKV